VSSLHLGFAASLARELHRIGFRGPYLFRIHAPIGDHSFRRRGALQDRRVAGCFRTQWTNPANSAASRHFSIIGYSAGSVEWVKVA
jgi:hypothetical protein